MKPSKTSKQWMNEHLNDVFVQQAQKEGYRSRAAYKLLEIDEKDQLLRSGQVVVDLGAAPGGWCQVVQKRLQHNAKIFALDILAMQALPNVTFIQGDFTEQAVLDQLESALNGRQLDLVISDMAPNMSGVAMADQARAIYLNELALDFALNHLEPRGKFLVKVFQGAGFESYLQQMRDHFGKVVTRKPKASRDRSREVYLLASHKKG